MSIREGQPPHTLSVAQKNCKRGINHKKNQSLRRHSCGTSDGRDFAAPTGRGDPCGPSAVATQDSLICLCRSFQFSNAAQGK